MLAKHSRLTKEEFDEVFEKGKSVRSNDFLIKFLKEKSSTKAAAVISKKKSPLSTDRNRIRRKVYTSLEQLREYFPKGVWVIVFVMNKDLPPNEEISEELKSLIKKVS